MPHTSSRYQQDLGFTDGIIMIDAGGFIYSGTGSATLTRNGVGDFVSTHAAAGVETNNWSTNLARGQMFRTGFGQDLQEQFGGTGIAADAEFQGRPDTLGAMSALQQLTPRTAFMVKGVKLLSIAVLYKITTQALTSITCRADKSVFANNVAIASSVVLASAANGLATATQANPYVTEVPIVAGNQVYQISDLSQIWFEVTPVMANTGVFQVYGIRVKVEFNFN